jgi:prepilin-type N-terminal cleavage/methylation domain-containing protein/prepilin-type processing-associated H-X9-DG protein
MQTPSPLFFPRSRCGFTLIELLTVIAIIGILAAILIPVVGKVRETARTAQCSTNIRSVGVAAILFGNDNRNATPVSSDSGNLFGQLGWYLQLVPYLGGNLSSVGGSRNALRVLVCPSSLRSLSGETDVPWNGSSANWPHIADYGYNSSVNSAAVSPALRRLKRFSDPINPAQTPLIHELVSQNNFGASNFNVVRPASEEAAFAAGQRQSFTQRHGGGGFILWFDGHISRMRYEEYMALANKTSPTLFVNGGIN